MKKYFLILFVFTTISSFAQTDYSSIKLDKDADYKPADKYALEASTFIFTVPMDKTNQQRQAAQQFVLKWMEGSPDYSFNIDASVMEKIVGENNGVLGLYMAAMAKYVLENPANASDFDLVKLNAAKTIVAYAENPANKLESKTVKKLIAANKKGELEKAVK